MLNVLIIVDVQPDFCEGGALAVIGGNTVAGAVAELVHDYRSQYDLIVTTQDWHNPDSDNGGHFSETPDFIDTWPVHCVAGSDGAAIHPEVEAELPINTFRFKKGFGTPSYSGFEAKWAGVLLGHFIDEVAQGDRVSVEVVGLATSHCVKATALDAKRRGYITHVAEDYVAGVTDELEEAAFRELREAGVFIF